MDVLLVEMCPRCKNEIRFLGFAFFLRIGVSDLKPSSMMLCPSAVGGSALYIWSQMLNW